MKYVVGSGPAGVACAKALVDTGHDVTMLDVGIQLEDDKQRRVERLRQGPHDWRNSPLTRRIVDGMTSQMLETASNGDVPQKLRYGSDFPYRDADERLRIRRAGVGGASSFARGGFSNVWGGNALPFRRSDIDDWPVPFEELQSYYTQAFQLFSVCGGDDDLNQLFPQYETSTCQLPRSNQAEQLMEQYRSRQSALTARGIHYGYSRVALSRQCEDACPQCGLAIFGCCPRGGVYESGETVASLRERDAFRYEPGVVVTGVEERQGAVDITGTTFDTGAPFHTSGERVFLACGAAATTKILMTSLGMVGERLRMIESPYVVFPALTYDTAGDVTEENPNTLSQLFIEITDPQVSDRTVHMQLYTYSKLLEETIHGRLGPLSTLLSPAVKPLLNRLVVVMGYLHSDHSDGVMVELTPEGELRLSGGLSSKTRDDVRAVMRKLQRNSHRTRLLPLSPWAELQPPCASYHVGGTFPMADDPGPKETDLLGRPSGFDRVHAVDATVFPSIPATTITPSIMAMAYRIGELSSGAGPRGATPPAVTLGSRTDGGEDSASSAPDR